MGGYDHIVVLQNIKVVDEHLVETVQQLPRGTHNGDCILLFSSVFSGSTFVLNLVFKTYNGDFFFGLHLLHETFPFLRLLRFKNYILIVVHN